MPPWKPLPILQGRVRGQLEDESERVTRTGDEEWTYEGA